MVAVVAVVIRAAYPPPEVEKAAMAQ